MLDLEFVCGLDTYDAFRRSLSSPHPDLSTARLVPYMRAQFRRIGDWRDVVALGTKRIDEDKQAWSDFTARVRG